MIHARKLVLAGVAALALAAPSNAMAANLVDGSISAEGDTCSWTNGSTSANPPSTLTIDRNSINGQLTCTGDVSATLNNSPTVSFNDAAGTATADSVDASVTTFGVTCRYAASNVTPPGDPATRTYSGTANAPKVSGSFFCPSSVDLTATVTFH